MEYWSIGVLEYWSIEAGGVELGRRGRKGQKGRLCVAVELCGSQMAFGGPFQSFEIVSKIGFQN